MLIGIDANEANTPNRVGIGQFAFNVVKELEKQDKTNSYLVYLKNPPLPDLPKQREGWGYRVFGPSKFWTQVSLPFKLFTQKEKLDVFYSPSHYAPRLSPFPTVISIMDLWHHRHPEQFNKKDLYQLKRWEGYSVKNASRIITISEFSKKEIIKFYQYPKDKITIAYPGYDKFRIGNREQRIMKIKKKYGIKGDYLLYLGTLQPKKNIEGLVEAFALVIGDQFSVTSKGKPTTGSRSPITLVIAGKKGWLYEGIFNQVKSLNLEKKVVFTGFFEEEEKPYLIAGARAFVLPSFYEGFGIPVVEAMSLKVPVVAARAGSLPEVGGQAAIYCNPEKPADIARAIEKVLNLKKSQRDEIIALGLKQVKKFSWEKCAKTILKTLKQINY